MILNMPLLAPYAKCTGGRECIRGDIDLVTLVHAAVIALVMYAAMFLASPFLYGTSLVGSNLSSTSVRVAGVAYTCVNMTHTHTHIHTDIYKRIQTSFLPFQALCSLSAVRC